MSQFTKRMSSGKYIDLSCFSCTDVDINDIEVALNNIVRFDGHYKDAKPLTVAQHSLLCLTMGELFEPHNHKLHLALFIHDFAEAYIGDCSSPVKKMLGKVWYDFADPIENCVEQHCFSFEIDAELRDKVKLYDLASMDIERRVMWKSQYGKDEWPASPLNVGTLNDKTELFNSVANEYVNVQEIWKGLYDDTL